jgi:hypothetical protein
MSNEAVNTNEEWVIEELAEIDLKDDRLNKRCQEIARALGEQPMAPINQACEDWADTKAAYRFFDNPKVTPEKITEPHRQRTVERMKEYDIVLAVQDTTFFNYTHHPKTEGLGEIGNKKQNQRGFGMHSTLAVAPIGTPLGLLTQEFFIRPIGEPAHKPNELRKLPIEEKESYRWIAAMEQTLALAPVGTEVVTVCDREADIYEMFVVAQEEHASLLVRASVDRSLDEQEEVNKLWQKAEQQPIIGELSVEITGNQKQKARQATVSIRFTQAKFKPPWRPNQKKLPSVTLNAILVREEKPPIDIDDPIEWLLLTNTPVNDFEAATRVVGWYGWRWQIETFHKVIKSGCTVEECRLQSAKRLQNFIALISVVAWRLHWLTYLHRTEPDLPCTIALTTVEWQTLYIRIHRSTEFPDHPPSISQTVRWIAQLGGFLGRKSDGKPGITVIWRGWQRLQDMSNIWLLVH